MSISRPDVKPVIPLETSSADMVADPALRNLNCLSVFYSNVRSLLPKIESLNQYVALYDPFVFAFCETWLDSSVPSSFFCPPGYSCFRRDRPNRRGGGSLILYKNSVDAAAIDVYPSSCLSSDNIDAVACKLCFSNKVNFGILCLYRPPDSTPDDNACAFAIISKFLEQQKTDRFVIVGDFNYPDISWPCHASSSQTAKLFLDLCQSHFLHQHVTVPTRKSSNAVLNLVFTSFDSY